MEERGSLTLAGMLIQGAIGVLASGSASLSGCTLVGSATLTATGGGSLSLTSTAVPAAVLHAAQHTLSGTGSTLRLDAVTVPEVPEAGALAGTMTSAADGSKTVHPPGFGTQHTGTFAVTSGPCTTSEGGRCVGRPEGYYFYEQCTIIVGGGGGVLGPCAVFDMTILIGDNGPEPGGNDAVTLPGGAVHGGSDCPEGAALAPGDAIHWASDFRFQGSVGLGTVGNGCAPKGTCGLPFNGGNNLGGGWELCFA